MGGRGGVSGGGRDGICPEPVAWPTRPLRDQHGAQFRPPGDGHRFRRRRPAGRDGVDPVHASVWCRLSTDRRNGVRDARLVGGRASAVPRPHQLARQLPARRPGHRHRLGRLGSHGVTRIGRWFDHRRSEQIARAPCHACHACRLGLDSPGYIRPDLRPDCGLLRGAGTGQAACRQGSRASLRGAGPLPGPSLCPREDPRRPDPRPLVQPTVVGLDDRGPPGRPDPPRELPVLDLRLSDGRASPLFGFRAATGITPGPRAIRP